ncbi:hypothetical protein L226DRAFT_215674 [Lentinus tigrinus ALCF2SS1-7]|uniref:Uncharacterized protein n=1 Tax=Lentinus tigrinus ALCF2SS1-6 TaxID=1328759 RepID=A0A5C2S954_9APHY|nr:hypothetical protein L227DRAFT_99021 [Lentinus tigrinus ALCF2SS1-6]RPD70866.1 hypothetical protein L226DRAFT_215674 [Lentinus tigrinus ALCF2SS1-7]
MPCSDVTARRDLGRYYCWYAPPPARAPTTVLGGSIKGRAGQLPLLHSSTLSKTLNNTTQTRNDMTNVREQRGHSGRISNQPRLHRFRPEDPPNMLPGRYRDHSEPPPAPRLGPVPLPPSPPVPQGYAPRPITQQYWSAPGSITYPSPTPSRTHYGSGGVSNPPEPVPPRRRRYARRSQRGHHRETCFEKLLRLLCG